MAAFADFATLSSSSIPTIPAPLRFAACP
jgi:hypothetical protein